MRIINIWCNGQLVSKNRDDIYSWIDVALRNHYEFKITWAEIKNEKVI